MKQEEHVHDWMGWSSWVYAGNDTEMQTRDCGDPECGYADANYRQHHHNWVDYPDPYAPVGSGLTMQVCAGCRRPK